jgi:hypothetical protein
VGRAGEVSLTGHSLTVVPFSERTGAGLASKLSFLPWLMRNGVIIFRELRRADAIHAPIPGDVGTVGMLLAWLFRKPLFVRHCGNWLKPVTMAEKFWRWFMETCAGGRNVMLATGGAAESPSRRNPNVHWIFASSLTEAELVAYASPRSGPANGQVRLVIVARQEKAKGAGTAIRSLPRLAQSFPEVSFEIVGQGSAIPELQRLAKDCGVADRVHFAGKLNHEEVMARLKAATLFVFPTTSSDGFPKAVLEGLASGLPMIATRVSVLPKLLGNGCGVLMDAATPDALAAAVEHALADRVRYESMSLRAVESARMFSLEAWRDTIGAMLEAAWGPLRTDKAESRKQKVEIGNASEDEGGKAEGRKQKVETEQ